MTRPDVAQSHHFQDLAKAVDSMKVMFGPIYDVQASHHYNEIDKHMEQLKGLQGPVYSIDRYGSYAIHF